LGGRCADLASPDLLNFHDDPSPSQPLLATGHRCVFCIAQTANPEVGRHAFDFLQVEKVTTESTLFRLPIKDDELPRPLDPELVVLTLSPCMGSSIDVHGLRRVDHDR
jgi:hypothetical protein